MNHGMTRLGPLLGVALLLTACTVARKRQVLTFFFDGVQTGIRPAAPAAVPAAEPAPGVPEIYLLARAAPTEVRHKPYAERQCLSCHESQFSQKLRGEVAEICQLCHQPLFERRPFRHAPVEAGYSLGCHQPHESTEKALLVLPGRQVCAECHDETLVTRSTAHARIGQEVCHTCHDPHGGQNRYFLKTPAPAVTAAPLAPAPS